MRQSQGSDFNSTPEPASAPLLRRSFALPGIILVPVLDLRRVVEVVDHQGGAFLGALVGRTPAIFSLSTRAPFDRWKCATGSFARLPVASPSRYRAASRISTGSAALRRVRSRHQCRLPMVPASAAQPVPAGNAVVRPGASSSLTVLGSCLTGRAQRRNPGIGDNVANVLRLRNSPDSSFDHALIREGPKLIPANPDWQLLIE